MEKLFMALMTGHVKAKWLRKHGTPAQRKLAGEYLKKESELKKFYANRGPIKD